MDHIEKDASNNFYIVAVYSLPRERVYQSIAYQL
jgi:hypothetical protein